MDTKSPKDSSTRIEPQSSEAEKAVLGSMLISKEAIPRAMSFLTEESFLMRKIKLYIEILCSFLMITLR